MRAAAEELTRLVGIVCEEHAAERVRQEISLGIAWTLQTKLGRLTVSMHCPAWHASEMLTVFGKFEEPARAVAFLGDSNPYTGKWNLHMFMDEASPEEVARAFEKRLLSVL